MVAPTDNERLVVAEAGSQPFREDHGRDRLVAR
jgi:hypothetical protein